MGLSMAEVRSKGWRALINELGYSGATKFILLYETGKGDYVEERKELFKEACVKDIVSEIEREKDPKVGG